VERSQVDLGFDDASNSDACEKFNIESVNMTVAFRSNNPSPLDFCWLLMGELVGFSCHASPTWPHGVKKLLRANFHLASRFKLTWVALCKGHGCSQHPPAPL
jgi:hypothetical protein